ncbi:tellurium resistance protein [Maritimibacter sp. 55A14]|uniref:gamma-glutamylcyclotransferase n=1 Tax=Maritimibacter sp. 55A14 TaxID=2174844 RepID=UPI000D60E46D|nr:gamma-glutamylcyclotransferase [Maritimibacter sp. 55A14]PWE34227.1 tellurium resistance protein [Maritimibacter sp. 55A14]
MMAERLFLYGTLRDPDLLAVVLGRDSAPDLVPARLHGHEPRSVVPGDYPVVLPCKGGATAGVLVTGLGSDEIARLKFYEGEGDHYRLVPVEVECQGARLAAHMFAPVTGWFETGDVWHLETWKKGPRMLALEAAREIMSEYGARSSRDVAERHGLMRIRAQSRLNARRDPPRPRIATGAGAAITRAHRRPYAKFFNVEEFDLDLPAFGGGRYRPRERAALVTADSVTVLPYDPRRDRVLLVEQFRVGPHARGDTHPWTLEPIAGRCEPDEDHATTLRREALEEAGLELAGGLERISAFYPSPGALSEFITAYLAPADLPDGIAGVHGLAEEGEDIRTHLLSFETLMAALDRGELRTAPLVVSAHWLARNRDRLRGAAGA